MYSGQVKVASCDNVIVVRLARSDSHVDFLVGQHYGVAAFPETWKRLEGDGFSSRQRTYCLLNVIKRMTNRTASPLLVFMQPTSSFIGIHAYDHPCHLKEEHVAIGGLSSQIWRQAVGTYRGRGVCMKIFLVHLLLFSLSRPFPKPKQESKRRKLIRSPASDLPLHLAHNTWLSLAWLLCLV